VTFIRRPPRWAAQRVPLELLKLLTRGSTKAKRCDGTVSVRKPMKLSTAQLEASLPWSAVVAFLAAMNVYILPDSKHSFGQRGSVLARVLVYRLPEKLSVLQRCPGGWAPGFTTPRVMLAADAFAVGRKISMKAFHTTFACEIDAHRAWREVPSVSEVANEPCPRPRTTERETATFRLPAALLERARRMVPERDWPYVRRAR